MDQNLKENKKEQEKKTCVVIESSPNGSLQLVNNCDVCKAALIERHYTTRTTGRRQAYRVSPNSHVTISSLEATKISMLAEINCP
jgi:hypothetical protein